MKKFLLNFLKFICAFILMMGIFEIFIINLPSEFKNKSSYLNENKDDIEILFLGSSHTQKAVNPEFIDSKSINLAHVGQSLDTDLYLLKKMTNQLKNLKLVFIELSYHILEEEPDGKDHWRNHLYLKYYNLNKFERPSFFLDQSLIYSNPKFFLRQIIFNKRNEKFNDYGYNLNDVNIFKGLNYNIESISNSSYKRLKHRHKEINLSFYNKNIKILNDFVEICKKQNIRIIVHIPPVYKTYINEMDYEKKNRRDSLINFFDFKKVNIINWEFENLDVKLFSDDDHLNKDGAELYSRFLNKKINSTTY
jgi:hypothetical protein